MPIELTQSAFLREYVAALRRNYDWAQRLPDVLEEFAAAAAASRDPSCTSMLWLPKGQEVREAWHAIGGTGRVTIRQLRALPRGDTATIGAIQP